MATRYEIADVDERTQRLPTQTPINDAQPTQNPSTVNNVTKESTKSLISSAALLSSGRRLATSSLGNVGDLTGNYTLQNQMDQAQTLINNAIPFFVNPVLGGLNLGVTIATGVIQREAQRSKINREVSVLRVLTGFNTNPNIKNGGDGV